MLIINGICLFIGSSKNCHFELGSESILMDYNKMD
jgi:hypothetical protein